MQKGSKLLTGNSKPSQNSKNSRLSRNGRNQNTSPSNAGTNSYPSNWRKGPISKISNYQALSSSFVSPLEIFERPYFQTVDVITRDRGAKLA